MKLKRGDWASPQSVRRIEDRGKYTWLEVVLTEGKNREVRRLMEAAGIEGPEACPHAHRPMHARRPASPAGSGIRLPARKTVSSKPTTKFPKPPRHIGVAKNSGQIGDSNWGVPALPIGWKPFYCVCLVPADPGQGIFTTSLAEPVFPSASLARIPIRCSPTDSSGVAIW